MPLPAHKAQSASTESAPPKALEIRVNSVVNALAVLRRLAMADRPEGVNAIARNIGISPSSCFNILKTLTAEDFAQFDPEKKTYTLGAGAVDLAIAALDPEAGFLRARSILEDIARAFRVTCGLWRRTNDRLILLGTVESEEIARIRFTPGQRLPAAIGAMGRCIAARSGMSEGDLAKAISALKWHEPPKFDRYLSEVRMASVNGYAVDDGNYLLGVTTVAAPIISREGALTHCIAATTFKGRLDREALRKLGKALGEASNTASPLLGSIR